MCGGLGHLKVQPSKGLSKLGVFEAGFEMMELGVDDGNLVMVVMESDRVGMESPLGDIREGAEEGMEGWSRAYEEIAEPSRQRLSGSVVLDEGLGVNVAEKGADRGSFSISEHGNLPLPNLLDPLGGLKKSSWPRNDE